MENCQLEAIAFYGLEAKFKELSPCGVLETNLSIDTVIRCDKVAVPRGYAPPEQSYRRKAESKLVPISIFS